jgi:AcrR family transcriptional regulator
MSPELASVTSSKEAETTLGSLPVAESKKVRNMDPAETQQRLRAAAFETLRMQGFRGATARNIAGVAGCNQAAIYYHFQGIMPLLVASLRESSDRRLAAYSEALAGITNLAEIFDVLEKLHVDDVASGHFAVLTELLGGVTAEPDLTAGLAEAVQEWLHFVAARVSEATQSMPLGNMIPARELADAIFSFVLGMQLQSRLDGDVDRFTRSLNLGRLVAMVVGPMQGPMQGLMQT